MVIISDDSIESCALCSTKIKIVTFLSGTFCSTSFCLSGGIDLSTVVDYILSDI